MQTVLLVSLMMLLWATLKNLAQVKELTAQAMTLQDLQYLKRCAARSAVLTRLTEISKTVFHSVRQQKDICRKLQTFFSVFVNWQFSQQTVSTQMKTVCRFR